MKTRVDASVILTALQRFDLSGQHLAAAERIAGADPELMKLVLSAHAGQAIRQGDFKRSLELLDRLQGLVTDTGDKAEEHTILVDRAQTYGGLADRKRALLELERAEALLPNDVMAACERQKVRSLIEYFARDFRSAAVAAERAIDHARGLGLSYEVAVNLHNLGEGLIRLSDFPRAYGAIRQSVALCDEFGFDRLASQNRMFLAFLDGVAGDSDRGGDAPPGHPLCRGERLHLGQHQRAAAARMAVPASRRLGGGPDGVRRAPRARAGDGQPSGRGRLRRGAPRPGGS